MITTDVKGRKYVVINAYAHTLPNSEKYPERREQFYQDLENAINLVSKRNILILGGDFNVKTGSVSNKHGQVWKRKVNSNGEHLLELASRNDLILTNTIFNHKMAHRTTWVAPERKNTDRRNQIRNQINYILVQNEYRVFVNDARSYNGKMKDSDHRIVLAKMNIDWHKKTPSVIKTH